MKKPNRCPSCKVSTVRKLYASSDRMLHINGVFSVWKCETCGISFLHPFLSQSALQKYYPSNTYYAYSGESKAGILQSLRTYLIAHYYSPTILSIFVSYIIHTVPAIPSKVQNGKILDVGCGTGDTLLALRSLGWDVYGMEMDKNAVRICKKRGLSQIQLGAFEDLKHYQDNSFDAIRLYHVIEHLHDPDLCFRLLYQKLKKNGELIIGTPNISSFIAKLFGTYWYNLDSPRHVFLFSPKTLVRMATRAGFSVVRIEYCSAGGLVGSIQYWMNDRMRLKIDIIHNLWCILIFYPIEWILDKLHVGDVFVMRLIK